jgi:hypothetical protein
MPMCGSSAVSAGPDDEVLDQPVDPVAAAQLDDHIVIACS